MWTPGLIGLVIGLLLLFSIKDDPETAGYPPIDEPAKSEQSSAPQPLRHTRCVHCVRVPPSRYPMPAVCCRMSPGTPSLQPASATPSQDRKWSTGGAAAKPKAKDERSLVTILVEECLKSRAVWLFAISYFL